MKYAPREIFEQILEWSVIPTFDLVIQYGDEGVIVVKRKIEPYKNVWALPGLRMFKGENIDDVLTRIAKAEVGLEIDPSKRMFIDQYVGKFKTEMERQDISTGYIIKVDGSQKISLNENHFSEYKIVTDIPEPIGAMYKHYLNKYWEK